MACRRLRYRWLRTRRRYPHRVRLRYWLRRLAEVRQATAAGDPLSILTKIIRNAGQDMLLARKLGTAATKDEWCAQARESANPETYLRIRDAIWRASQ